MDHQTAFRTTLALPIPGWSIIQRIDADTRGMTVYQSSEGHSLAFGFDGTRGAFWPPSSDWLENFKAWKKADGIGQGRAHAGFLAEFRDLQADIDAVIRVYQPSTVILAGFSQGAAIATLAWRYLVDKVPALHCINFASPRLFDALAAEEFDKILANSTEAFSFTRVSIWGDPVPTLPFALMGFRHVGPVEHIGPWKMLPDYSVPTPIHQTQVYLDALRKAP